MASALPSSAAPAHQIPEFDRVWGTGITRTREILEAAEQESA